MGLRFNKIEIYQVCIPFRFAYTHALANRKEADSFIIALTTEKGDTGYGETIPRSYLTGEDINSVWNDLRSRWWPRICEIEINNYSELIPALGKVHQEADITRHTASYTGIELACIDAAGKSFTAPARSLIASNEPSQNNLLYCTGPIGSTSVKKTRWLARIFKLLNFHDIKLKVGLQKDKERLEVVRKICGQNLNLRVDANAAWSTEEALKNCALLKKQNISSLEQPVNAKNISGMVKLKQESGIQIMADESLCSQSDAEILIANKACDIFNIRLAKCGGFIGCFKLLKKAKAAGIDTQFGVLVGETSILTAAGQEFLSAVGPQRHIENCFPRVFLKTDPARGAAGAFWNGCAKIPSPKPGFGISILPQVLDAITVSKEVLNRNDKLK